MGRCLDVIEMLTGVPRFN